ncbi:hypothetical protein ACFLQN_02755 [Candidatus Aenigmatarchaeota archaeon]
MVKRKTKLKRTVRVNRVKTIKKAKTGRKKRRGKAKYNKLFIEVWKCKDCAFEWSYQTLKCPICSSIETLKVI